MRGYQCQPISQVFVSPEDAVFLGRFTLKESGAKLPDLHSPQWFPELEPTLRSLVAAEVIMLAELLVAPESANK